MGSNAERENKYSVFLLALYPEGTEAIRAKYRKNAAKLLQMKAFLPADNRVNN